MKSWFASRNIALALSLLALLSLLARSYYDTRFILVEEFSPLMPGMDILWILGYTVIVGGYMTLLLASTSNRQGVWIALFTFNLVIGLGFGAASLLAYTNNLLEFVIFTTSLITGLLAALAVGLQFRQS